MKRLITTIIFSLPLLLVAGLAQSQANQTMNPNISVIIDTYLYSNNFQDDAGDAIDFNFNHLGEVAGLGLGHSHDEDGHEEEHHHAEEFVDGFNLRHIELGFNGNIDTYFKAQAIAAVSNHGAELEIAQIETLSLPLGLAIRAGKFKSDVGRLNAEHTHAWDFTTQPLVHKLFFGSHGINDIGVQLSWLSSFPFYLKIGAEAFQTGGEETGLAYIGGDQLPHINAPLAGAGWIKFGPDLGDEHGLLMGLSLFQGVRQEEHDGNDDEVMDHWLSGWTQYLGLDLVYKYDAPQAYGQGDLKVQAEYFLRRVKMDVFAHDLAPQLVGKSLTHKQDGFYVQTTYGFLPNWRLGARYDHVGSFNTSTNPMGLTTGFPASNQVTGMVDLYFTEFSMLRAEVSYSELVLTDEGTISGISGGLQLTVSLGAHGAHQF